MNRRRACLSVFVTSFAALTALGSAACHEARPDEPLARADHLVVARVEVLAGRDCGDKANVVSAPEHCVLSREAARRGLVSTDAQFVAAVAADGHAGDVRLLKVAEGLELEDAVRDCARHVTYAPGFDAHGKSVPKETCPVTLRLTRPASDVVARDPVHLGCPSVRAGDPLGSFDVYAASHHCPNH